MAIFLFVLKIIGLVLLCLLLLILALICIVLFVPVRYKARINKDSPDNGVFADANVSFLLYMVLARAKYDSDFDFYIKILGFKIKKKESLIEESEETNALEDAVSYDSLEYTVDWNEEDNKTEEAKAEDKPEEAKTEAKPEDANAEETISDKVVRFMEKVSSKSDSIKKKIENIESKYQRMSGLINDSRNQKAASYIYKVLLKLLKHYIPKRVKGYVHFGFDDPATTGKILMYLGILYPVLPKKVTIDPDFEDTDIFGNLYIKGRIRLIHLAVAAFKLLIDKNVRRLWRLYKKSN